MPTPLLILLALILGLPAAYFAYDWYSARKLKAWLSATWASEGALRRPDDDQLTDIADYWRAVAAHSQPEGAVDDITWGDLDMDQVFRVLDRSRAMVGSEVLYALLRQQGTSEEELLQRETLADAFMGDAGLRQRVQLALHPIGYKAFHGASRYLYAAAYQYPPHRWLYPVLGLLPLSLLLLGLLDSRLVIGAIFAFALNLFVYYRTQKTWEKELATIRHIGAVLRAAQALSKEKAEAFAPYAKEMAPLVARLWKIRRWLPMFGMETWGDAAFLLEYLKIFFMLDMVSLGAIVGELNKRGQEVRRLYALVGEADACLSLAQVRQAHPDLCVPAFHQQPEVNARGLRHPLIDDCVPNHLLWQRNALISGSNASGKSTFIKALAVNLILAQTLHLCWAEGLSLKRGTVMTSMAVRDNIMGGESYFIVELKSLKRILDAAGHERMVYCFVDEILRGTNTIERIAASASVLRSLAGQNMLCMTATHDIELTRMLDSLFDNLHFSETVGEGGVSFDYQLREGPTRTRNALRLLKQMGYPEDVVAHAQENARAFEETCHWPAQR